MYRILYFVCCLLFLVIVESRKIQDGTFVEKYHKHPKHHYHKTRSTFNEVARKRNVNVESDPSTTEDPATNMEEKNTDTASTDAISDNPEEHVNVTEDNIERTGDNSRTIFMGSLATHMSAVSDVSSDSYDFNKEDFNFENVDNPTVDVSHDDSGEMLVQTPHDVIDLKARSGYISEADDANMPDMSEIENSPQLNITSRSGYVPPDEVEHVLKPPQHLENEAHHINRPISYSNDHLTQTSNPNPRSEMMYRDAPLNYRQTNPPLFFESSNSREKLYPIMNGRGFWPQGNTGQQTKSYFGLNQPNNQYYNYRERCPKCTQEIAPFRERGYRRTVDATSSVLETANGRSVDFDPSGANAYPLVQDKGINHVQESHNEITNSGMRDAYASQEAERNVNKNVMSNRQSDPDPLSTYLQALYPYLPRGSPALLHRPGLIGIQRFLI